MAKLVLHIGTEKTGTTAIQECLHANRDRLLSQFNFFVPTAYARYRNHRCLMEIVPGLNAPQSDMYGEISNAEGADFDAQKLRGHWLRSFEHDAEHHADRCFLLSSEQFHSRLDAPHAAEHFLQFLSAYFSEIRVVVFLRDPFSGAAALRSTMVVNGHCLVDPLEPEDDRVQLLCDHASTLQRWQDALERGAFEVARLEPHLYAPEEFPQRCAARNFVRLLGIENVSEFQFPAQRVNESLAPRELALLNHFNRLSSFAGNDREGLVEARALLARLKGIPQFSVQRQLTQDAALAERFAAFYRASNDWIHRQYFAQRSTLFAAHQPSVTFNQDIAEETFKTLSAHQSRSRFLQRLREVADSAPR